MKRRFAIVLILLLELAVLAALPALGQDYTSTPNLALKLPKTGSTNWGIYINQDFTTLDTAIGVFHGGFFVVPFSATPVFDLTKGNTFQLTMSGNVTSSTVNQPGVTSGQFLYLIVCQDATGSRTFTFPASFQAPFPAISPTPSKCSASTWVWSTTFNVWINVSGGGGGGGGGTPAPPAFSIQKADSAALNFAASSLSDNGTTVTVSEPVSLSSSLTVATTLGVTGLGTFTANISVGGTQIAGSASGTATLPANTGTIAELNLGQTWTAAQTHNAATLLLNPGPLTLASAASTGRTATFPDNTGTVAELNLAETWTANQMFNAGTALLNPGPITLASAGSAARTATFPDNTGTVAELNLAQTWTANQSIANGNSIRWFSTNGTNYAGFTGGASTTNLVWLFPTTDSSGTQCLSSNGSLQLAWSACSAGTGTPGGSNTNVQYNNAGSFGGSGNFTFNGTGLVGIGLVNTTLGQLQLFGSTSGSVTIQPQAVAGGTLTFTLPNASGTAQVSASAPLVASATTGNLTCPTCTTNAAALTANQLVIGGGGQATAALGSLGTTTTVLHGNASGAPTFGAVNLATDVTSIAAIANGGTGQSTASAAFNALSPITSTGDLILGTGTNTAGRLALGGNGLCLTSNGATAVWASCASGAVGGTAASGQGTFWNGSATIAGNVNWTYSATSGHSVTQGANAADALYMKRQTDSTPTGNFLHFQNAAANTDVFKVDVAGNATMQSVAFNGANAGGITLVQGPAPALVANAIELIAPTSVAAGGEQFVWPGNPATGFSRWTNSAGVMTGTLVPASGIGDCTPSNKLVIQTNDNAAPTCSNVFAAMFTSQGANQVLIAPNGSSGVPTFRILASGDVPAINLNSTGNGGITNILQIANGGTNASTAAIAFNNLSPMTTAGDIIYGGTSGAGTRLAAGSSTQVLISGTTPSWGAVNLGTMTTGTAAIGNGGTGQTTASAAFNALAPTASANALIYSNGTNTWTSLAAGGAGTLCLIETAGGAPTWGSCSGGASTSWSNLTNPSGNLSLSMAANTTTFTWGAATGSSVNPFTITDTSSNTGTGDLVLINTASSSALSPLRVAAKGTANGIEMNTSGVLASIGSGSITANTLNQSLNTTSPITGGGTQTSALTIACATCVTSGASLTNNQFVIGSGGGQGTTSLAAGTTKQVLIAGGPPSYIDFPNMVYAAAADCVNGTAGSAWSTGATPAALCRAGTNNKSALLSPWGASDVGYFQIHLPKDWDTSSNPFLMLELTSTDTTNSHTIIMQESVGCAKLDGTTTDDVAFNAARSLSTITLNGNANRTWEADLALNSTDMTGCSAPGIMWVKISRTTDTATNVGVYGATVTVPRLITVQAN